MKINIKLFAMIREIVGESGIVIEVSENSTINEMMELFYNAYPSARAYHEYMRVAVNREYVPFSHRLHDNDEVAFIPPVSGG